MSFESSAFPRGAERRQWWLHDHTRIFPDVQSHNQTWICIHTRFSEVTAVPAAPTVLIQSINLYTECSCTKAVTTNKTKQLFAPGHVWTVEQMPQWRPYTFNMNSRFQSFLSLLCVFIMWILFDVEVRAWSTSIPLKSAWTLRACKCIAVALQCDPPCRSQWTVTLYY